MRELPDWQKHEMMESEISRALEAFDSVEEYRDWCKEFGKKPDKVILRRLKTRDAENECRKVTGMELGKTYKFVYGVGDGLRLVVKPIGEGKRYYDNILHQCHKGHSLDFHGSYSYCTKCQEKYYPPEEEDEEWN